MPHDKTRVPDARPPAHTGRPNAMAPGQTGGTVPLRAPHLAIQAAGALSPRHSLAMQPHLGNAAIQRLYSGSGPATGRESSPAGRPAPGIVQRVVDLDDFNERLPEHVQLSKETLSRLQEIQQLLADPARVQAALKALEESASGKMQLPGVAGKPTRALNAALQDVESEWMNPGRVKLEKGKITRQGPKEYSQASKPQASTLYTRSTSGAQLPPDEMVDKAVLPLAGLKDVGAAVSHGEYPHRLQWQIIYHHLNEKFNKERSEGPGSGSELRHLYLMMSNPERVIDHPLGLQYGDGPAQISLWDAVLDAQGSWTVGKFGKDTIPELKEMYQDARFAAPALLTAVLTDRKRSNVLKNYDETLKGMSWVGQLPIISKAVTDRKLKRQQQPK